MKWSISAVLKVGAVGERQAKNRGMGEPRCRGTRENSWVGWPRLACRRAKEGTRAHGGKCGMMEVCFGRIVESKDDCG